MKTFRTLIAIAAVFFFNCARAQSISPGFQSSYFGGYAHLIDGESITLDVDVDLDGQFGLLRTVETKEFGSWNDFTEIGWLSQPIYVSGDDEFTVPISAQAVSWAVRVHYRYLQDPDGSGPLNIGDDAVVPLTLDPIQPKPDPDPEVVGMVINGPYLSVDVSSYRHVSSTDFAAELVLEVRNTDIGAVVWYDSTAINPAGSVSFVRSYYIYLLYPGQVCVTARLRYSHNGPGYHDFQGVLVGETDGNNCLPFNGIPTGISDEQGSEATVSVYPNPATSQVTISGFAPDEPLIVFDPTGRTIRRVAPGTTTMDVSGLAAGTYVLRSEQTARFVRFDKN